MDLYVKKSGGLRGEAQVPGDKSISHRAAMLLPLCQGDAVVYNFLLSEDCVNTVKAMRMMGAQIDLEDRVLKIKGRGKKSINNAKTHIYLGNSGTSIRLLSGILSSLEGTSIVYGDESLSKRPMKRIIDPLRKMGADIKSLYDDDRPPIVIKGGKLSGIDYNLEVASAQVKSCIMLASLFAEGRTKITEIAKTRDHTERMLRYLGCEVSETENTIEMVCGQELFARNIFVPSDISSAAFLMGAAIITPNSELILRNILFNETRTGIIDVLKKMGANIEILEIKQVNNEDVADIRIKTSHLKGISIGGDIIPRLIDEIPLIAVLASFAEGTTYIKDAEELKYKETDRIKTTTYNLRELGVEVEETSDGMVIQGNTFRNKKDYVFNSFGDHRIAMAFSLVGFVFDNVTVLNCDNINTSFPNYVDLMNSIGANIFKR
jgi:3-phosphoshikimate 1-carboxyvinyltransferase